MNKVVRHHVPVGELPERLREGFDAGEIVEVAVRSLDAGTANAPPVISIAEVLRRLEAAPDGAAQAPPEDVARHRAFMQDIWDAVGPRRTTTEEAVRRIRHLRDEGEE